MKFTKIKYFILSVVLFVLSFSAELLFNKVTDISNRTFDAKIVYIVDFVIVIIFGITLPLHFHIFQNIKFNKIISCVIPLIFILESFVLYFTTIVEPYIAIFLAVFSSVESLVSLKNKDNSY